MTLSSKPASDFTVLHNVTTLPREIQVRGPMGPKLKYYFNGALSHLGSFQGSGDILRAASTYAAWAGVDAPSPSRLPKKLNKNVLEAIL